mgnify:CR=1 FL=1
MLSEQTFNIDQACNTLHEMLISKLPGEPWKGPLQKNWLGAL